MSQVLSEHELPALDKNGPLLQIKDLVVSFITRTKLIGKKSEVRAVNGVSFEIKQGEILSIVGESGSGKTTIARCILMLANASFGSILYKSEDVHNLRGQALREYKHDVQIIFQDPFESLNPRQDTFTSISVPLRFLVGEKNKSELRKRISELLVEVGLSPNDVMYKYPHQLSGGERQRVNIARALASNPRLLIADEPVTMLDASQRLNILSLLMRLKMKRNLSILLITHDLASSKIMSDRTAVMFLGKIVEIGPTDVILSRPAHPYSAQILAATPSFESPSHLPVVTKKNAVDVDPRAGGCIYRSRCAYAKPVCESTTPELEKKSQDRAVACHFPLD